MKNQKVGRKNNNLIYLLFAVAAVLIVVSLFMILSSKKPLQVQEYDVFFVVQTGGIGIDVNNTLLTFGHVNPGSGAMRRVTFENEYNFPLMVETSVSKNLLGLIDTNSTFFVASGENTTIPVELSVPKDFPLGNYSGKIRFEMYKAD